MNHKKCVALLFAVLTVFASIFSAASAAIGVPLGDTGLNADLVVDSPNRNTVYNGTLPLDFTIYWGMTLPIPWLQLSSVTYGIDGSGSWPIMNGSDVIFSSSSSTPSTHATGTADISGLSNGKHYFTVSVQGDYDVNNDFVFHLRYTFDPVYFAVNIPVDLATPPTVQVISPQSQTYSQGDVPLNFTIDQSTRWVTYSLDGARNVSVSGNTALTGLKDDFHNVVVYASNREGDIGASQTVNFTVAVPPQIIILSPINQTYNETTLPLSFAVDKSLGWVGYSLDSQENVTVTSNSTLTNMTDGFHSVVVYANGSYGGMAASQNATFTVAIPPPPSPQNDFTFPAAVAVSVLLVGAVFTVAYFKMLKKKQPKT